MIYFGPLAAQDDPQIQDYYHITAQCQKVIEGTSSGTEFIFSSRPGAGKTAFVAKLSSLANKPVSIVIKPENTQLATEDDNLNVEDHKILIEHELLAALVSELHVRGFLKGELDKEWSTYFKQQLAKTVEGFFGERFQGISILGCGFTLKPSERLQYLAAIKRSHALPKLRAIFTRILTSTKPLVVIDNPESLVAKGMDEISADNSKKLGAFLSVLGGLHGMGCPTAVFVKEYVLQSVLEQYIDVVHYSDGIASIQWNRDDLLNLIDLRVKKRLKIKWGTAFAMSEDALADYLFPLLVNGPRDLLLVLNTAGKQADKISKEHLQASIQTLRTQRLADCERQYGRKWTKISQVVKAVLASIPSSKRNQTISKDQLVEFIRQEHQKPGSNLHSLRKSIDWVNTAMWDEPSIDSRLYLCGCVGFELHDRKIYPWMGGTLSEYREAKRVFVSQLFAEM